MNPRRERRRRTHTLLAIVTGAILSSVVVLSPKAFVFSLATAYEALALFVVTLSLGPLNLLQRRPNPVSTDLRRDVGMWTAGVSCVHVVFGWQVHMKHWWQYVLTEPTATAGWRPRLDVFGLTNNAGLMAALLLVLLVVISNDMALKRFGAVRWKQLQRLTYAAAVLALLHGFAFQVIEKRTWWLIMVLAVSSIGAISVQWAGRRAWLARSRERATDV